MTKWEKHKNCTKNLWIFQVDESLDTISEIILYLRHMQIILNFQTKMNQVHHGKWAKPSANQKTAFQIEPGERLEYPTLYGLNSY